MYLQSALCMSVLVVYMVCIGGKCLCLSVSCGKLFIVSVHCFHNTR